MPMEKLCIIYTGSNCFDVPEQGGLVQPSGEEFFGLLKDQIFRSLCSKFGAVTEDTPTETVRAQTEILPEERRQLDDSIITVSLDPLPLQNTAGDDLVYDQIGEAIETHYNDANAFIVVRFIDDIEPCAAYLTFGLENLSKPVILTDSYSAMTSPRNILDANIIEASNLAVNLTNTVSNPGVVATYFNGDLVLGCHAVHTQTARAFSSDLHPLLADNRGLASFHVYQDAFPSSPMSGNRNFSYRPFSAKNAPDDIWLAFSSPGIQTQVISQIPDGTDSVPRAVFFHDCGNIPRTVPEVTAKLEKLRDNGVIVVAMGMPTTEADLHATNDMFLHDMGIISGSDMTPQTALAKLRYLLRVHDDNDIVRQKMRKSLRGEISNFNRPALLARDIKPFGIG